MKKISIKKKLIKISLLPFREDMLNFVLIIHSFRKDMLIFLNFNFIISFSIVKKPGINIETK